MNKLTKLILWLTHLWWVVLLIAILIIEQVPEFRLQLREADKIIPSIFYILMGTLAIFMTFRMLFIARKRKTVVSEVLFGFFLLSGVSALIQGFFGVFEFTYRPLQTFWTDSAFLFIAGSTFMLGFFIIEIFLKGLNVKKNKMALLILGIIVCLANIAISLNITTEYEFEDIFTYSTMAFLIVATLWLYIVLISKSFQLKKRMESSVEKQAFVFIGISGILLMIAYLLVIAYTFTDVLAFRISNAIFFMIGYLSLYRGFTLPMKNK